MAFEQIQLAGNQNARYVFRVTPLSYDCSDLTRITAWDTYACSSYAYESLAGTAANGFKSSIAAFDTTNQTSGAGWATGLTATSGAVHNGANRLKGGVNYVELGDGSGGVTPPVTGEKRWFQLAFSVCSDSTAGTTGHACVLSITMYYTGTAPTPKLEYNSSGTDTDAGGTWVTMMLRAKDDGSAGTKPFAIYATGPDTTTGSLDPVTKPSSGEAWAEEYWSEPT